MQDEDISKGFAGGTAPHKWIPGKITTDYDTLLISVGGSRGQKNYLQVKHRLMMLRELAPEAEVNTECTFHDPDAKIACFKATVLLPNGACGTGHGSETSSDFGDYYEKAETKAVGRALNAVGIGIQYDYADWGYEEENKKPFKGVDSPVDPVVTTRPDLTVLPRLSLLEIGNREKERVGAERMVAYANDTQKMGLKLLAEANDEQLRTLIVWAWEQPSKP